MKYTVKWIINGEVIKEAKSKEEAEVNVKKQLEKFIDKNKSTFEELGASAIQGSAHLIK
tara:strand:+ start:706 stop:882 length:177 start_codon:yes stop_codon:yes gene_type:complete